MSFLCGRKIEAMYRYYGADTSGRICGDCQHLSTNTYDKVYYKCPMYGISHSAATDWRKKWQACMLIDREVGADFVPVIERLKYEPRRKGVAQIEGQIEMEI